MGEHSVVFVEGVHYPIGKDGHADLSKPLRWKDGDYRPAKTGEANLHNDVYAAGDRVVEPGAE